VSYTRVVRYNAARALSGALGQFVIDVPPQCFGNELFNDCYYQYLGYAQTECTNQDVVSMYADYQDCVRDLVQNDVWSRCIPQHCPEQVQSRGVPKYEPYPLNRESEQTRQLQKDVNDVLRQMPELVCELLTEDGKLGPLTCGAARMVDPGIVPPTCVTFTEPKCSPKVVARPTPVQPAPTKPAPTKPAPKPAPTKPKLTKADMLTGGLLVAGLGAGVYFIGKKKGWFQG
jgi:hypothetical protein